jgi:hypothetical protein
MRTDDEIYKGAVDGSPFSNSTEWEYWAANWCYRCANDGIGIGKDTPMCPIIGISLVDKTPSEWLISTGVDKYQCIEFKPRDKPDDHEGPPPPDEPMPGQELLFDPEPYRGVRMWADVVDEARPVKVGTP